MCDIILPKFRYFWHGDITHDITLPKKFAIFGNLLRARRARAPRPAYSGITFSARAPKKILGGFAALVFLMSRVMMSRVTSLGRILVTRDVITGHA